MSKKLKIVAVSMSCNRCEVLEREIAILKAKNDEWAHLVDRMIVERQFEKTVSGKR